MNKSDIEALGNLMEEKIAILKNYSIITQQLLTDEMDNLDSLFNVRQKILDDYLNINIKIDLFVSKQEKINREELNLMLKHNKFEGNKIDFAEIKQMVAKVNLLIAEIKDKDKDIKLRIDGYKQQLVDDTLKLKKSKKIIEYMGSTSISELFMGKSFDQKQ